MSLFIGRLHILVLHFPIAFVLLAAGLAVFGLVRRQRIESLPMLTHISTVSTLVTVVLGLVLFSMEDYRGETLETLELHRLLGISSAVLMLITSWVTYRFKDKQPLQALLLLAASGTIIFGAHQGGVSIHGDNFLSLDSTPAKPPVVVAAPPAPAEPATPRIVPYKPQIKFLITNHCVRCHGHKKQKGGLRLDSEAAALQGGESGPVIVPGDAAASSLYRRITLPAGHEDVMPAKGELLGPKQQGLIRDWINQGAKWN